jgi:DNA topoisomerase-1
VRDFPEIVDVKFTAGMENELDEIEEKRKNWRDVLNEFYVPFERDLQKATNDMRVTDVPTDDKCEACGSPMIQKWSKKGGWFLACTKYPECTQTKSISVAGDGRRAVQEKKHLDEKCPECGKPLVERQSRYGKFIACSGFPKCRYIKKDKADIPCPREGCDGKIVRKIGKGRRGFYACTKYPECTFTAAKLSDIETADAGKSESESDAPV